MSIETLPELSLKLLETKSRYEYRWWGNDLFWFSFEGIILPLRQEQEQSGRTLTQGPVAVNDQNGEPTTIEQLIIKHKRKKLLETPMMLDVIERKWNFFASDLYAARIIKFSAMLASVFVASVLPLDSTQFYIATASVAATWALNLQVELAKLRLPVQQDLTFVNGLDLFHLVSRTLA